MTIHNVVTENPWEARCECGWRSGKAPSEIEAKEAANHHQMLEHPEEQEIRWETIQ